MDGRILVVDDDKLLLDFLDEVLSEEGYAVTTFESPVEATKYLKKHPVDLVISDVKMHEMTGDEVLSFVQTHLNGTGTILMTGFGNITHAVRAIRKGAYDYITKPFKSHEILSRVQRFFSSDSSSNSEYSAESNKKQKEQQEVRISPGTEKPDSNNQFVGEDPKITKLLNILPQIAGNDAPVFIQGESGTGKEVFAHQIHTNSHRAGGPYIKINCANLPKELVESTLFGHKKGAFTGAVADHKGAFEAADGGTLLLDEITEIDINIQAKLLRVLQEKEFYKVGSQEPIESDVRIIATSNRNIAETISEGSFREDLYYRINVFPITIPPLRHRRGDIPVLAKHFVQNYVERYGMEEKEISEELMDYLINKDWRGNVRELNNKIHRGVILSYDSPIISLEHVENNLFSNVDKEIRKEIMTEIPIMPIEQMELKLIKKTLEHTDGNQKRAAELLGISDRTIRNKLKNLEQS